MLIRLFLTEIQSFENVKIYKEIYGHPDAVSDSVRMAIGGLGDGLLAPVLVNFDVFLKKIAVSQSKLA